MLRPRPSVFTEGPGVSVYVPFGFPKRLFGSQARGPKLGFMCGLKHTIRLLFFAASSIHKKKRKKKETHWLLSLCPPPALPSLSTPTLVSGSDPCCLLHIGKTKKTMFQQSKHKETLCS